MSRITRFMSATAVGVILLMSCKDHEIALTDADSSLAATEAELEAYFGDIRDLSFTIIASDSAALDGDQPGRTILKPILDAHPDTRFACDGASISVTFESDNTSENPHGVVTIDFGAGGCTDAQGDTRKGIVTVKFQGLRFMPGSTMVVDLSGYKFNDVQLSGTITMTSITGSTEKTPVFDIVLANGAATWPDQTTATREASLVFEWQRLEGGGAMIDQLNLAGTASGTSKNNAAYSAEISTNDPLFFLRSCTLRQRSYVPVQGTEELTVGGKTMLLDYGNGNCDLSVKVKLGDQSTDVQLN